MEAYRAYRGVDWPDMSPYRGLRRHDEIRIAFDVVVIGNALIRGRSRRPSVVGDAVLVGRTLTSTEPPSRTVPSSRPEPRPFRAQSLYGSELRINCVLHVNSRLEPHTVGVCGALPKPGEVHDAARVELQ